MVNKTGYDFHIWSEGNSTNTDFKLLKNNSELPWRFGDWRVSRESTITTPNKIAIQLTGPAWESLKGISVDREGIQSFILRPSIDRVIHQVVCEVKLKDNVKIVTIRSSAMVLNSCNVPLELVIINLTGKMTSAIQIVEPGQEFCLPIISSYSDRILIRPAGIGYQWSKEVLYWKELQRDVIYPLITCVSTDPHSPPFIFQINSDFPLEAKRWYLKN